MLTKLEIIQEDFTLIYAVIIVAIHIANYCLLIPYTYYIDIL